MKKFGKIWLNPVMAQGGGGSRKTRGTRPCRWRRGWTRIWIIRLDKVLSRKVVLCFLPALDYLYGRSSWPTPTPRGGGEQLIQ